MQQDEPVEAYVFGNSLLDATHPFQRRDPLESAASPARDAARDERNDPQARGAQERGQPYPRVATAKGSSGKDSRGISATVAARSASVTGERREPGSAVTLENARTSSALVRCHLVVILVVAKV